MTSHTSSGSAGQRTFRVALIGNPNTGKSTLFNALSGLRVRTGNYPGVTVEQRIGRITWDQLSIDLIDLPGTYSLAAKSPDEMVAVQVLTGCGTEPPPDLVICICNAAALERNLYLATQVLELGLPVILCLNMWDAAVRSGVSTNVDKLSHCLGVPVVATSASRREGLDDLQKAVVNALRNAPSGPTVPSAAPSRVLSEILQSEITSFRSWLHRFEIGKKPCSEFLASRAILDPGGSIEDLLVGSTGQTCRDELTAIRKRLDEQHQAVPAAEARQRYHYIGELLSRVQTQSPEKNTRLSDRIDAVLTNSMFGFVICLAVLMLVFSTIYWFSTPLSDGVEAGLGMISGAVEGSLAPGPLRSLLTDGVISGVGSVIVFLPQICLLFLFIGLLEDCGYMARAAYMMDRIMSLLGLSGRSFLPLMSSFACAVPGIMATRVIDDRRDRFVTILIAPLMSCSARLPVYVLLIGTFIPDQRIMGNLIPLRAAVLFLMSSLGLIIAVPVALILRKTVFRGEGSPFLLELPDYRVPALRVVLLRVWESAWSFIARAGTLIFATSVLVWLAGSWPGDHSRLYELQAEKEKLEAAGDENAEQVAAITQQMNQLNAESLRNSVLGRVGRTVEPIFRPLGWDWRIGVGVLASFPAREVIIATLGTIYSLGGDVDEEDEGLKDSIRNAMWPDGTRVFNIPVALSVMVFFALCAQCVSTLMVIKRETNSWKWPAACFVYMTTLAWVGAFLTYQIGMRL